MVRQMIGAAFGAAALLLCVAPALADRQRQGEPVASPAAPIGTSSGLPVPRFVSLAVEGANARRGPDAHERVNWIYTQVGLPLQVTGESGQWRRVRDPAGAQSWMHMSNLDNRRTAFVRGLDGRDTALRNGPHDTSRVRAYLAPGVVGALTGCDGEWRRIAVGLRVGWVHRDTLWGAADCAGI